MAGNDRPTRRRPSAARFGAGLLALALLGLAGCAADTSCVNNTQYVNAKSFPPLKSPPGLHAPKPNQDMQVPAVPSGPVMAYATTPSGVDPGSPIARCLTTPPPLQKSS